MAVFTLKSGGVTWHVRSKKKKEAPSGAFVGPNQRDHMHELAQRSVNWLALVFFHKMRGVCYGGILGFPCWPTDTFTLWYSSQRARRSFWACPIVVLCGLQDASLPLLTSRQWEYCKQEMRGWRVEQKKCHLGKSIRYSKNSIWEF